MKVLRWILAALVALPVLIASRLRHARRHGHRGGGWFFAAVVCFGIAAGLATEACADPPGTREEWILAPAAEDFYRVAGPHGFVVALSPDRWAYAVDRVVVAEAEAKALREMVAAVTEQRDALRRYCDTLEDEARRRETWVLRLESDLTSAERAVMRAPGSARRARWLGRLEAAAVAGLVAWAAVEIAEEL